MLQKIEGIVPVMLTVYTDKGRIDYKSIARLIEWYLAHGADALFAVCQSSEMQFLSVSERGELARFVVQEVNGKVPVVVSGHISDDPYSQLEELQVASTSGADGVVLVSNHLDPKNKGSEVFLGNLQWLLERLPSDIPLGIYECPVPYRRLVSDEELRFLADTERFLFMKDVSCDLTTVKKRVEITQGSNMVILNANAAIAWDAMQAGSKGFNGVSTNYHPDLYKWLYVSGKDHPDLAREISNFLVLAACTEAYGYPMLAKLYHKSLGNFETVLSRSYSVEMFEKVWAKEVILENLMIGTDFYRNKIRKFCI